MSYRVLLRLLLAVGSAACLVLIPTGSALAGDPNAGDVWVDNVGQLAGPGHEMDPHLACQDINLWGSGLADSSGSYTIDGWPPSGSQERDYGASNWSYDRSTGGSQVLDVIPVKTLIEQAIAHGDVAQSNQGFHFKLEFSQDPQKHKTFWVNCQIPTIATTATSATVGQPVHDVAMLTGGDAPTGTITWNVYAAGTGCATSLDTISVMVSGDGTYNSPDYTQTTAGTYQWVASYSGDANNTSVASQCNDPNERSTVQTAPAPGIALVKLERDGSSASFAPGPLTGNVGDTVGYQMTVINTGNTPLVITFTDPHCDAGTLSAPRVLGGGFDSATSTLSDGGELQYTCSHVLAAGDAPQFTNTASVSGQPPAGPPVTATSSVVAFLNTPGMTVVKLQRDGSSGAFTTATIPAMVGDTLDYEIQVTNTGNTPLALSLSDPHCDAGTIHGPLSISGTLSGDVLSPGGRAQYTCSHMLGSGDVPSFTNTGTITGQPPSGPPLSGTGVVVANVTTAGIHVVKLQRDGSTGAFTAGTITAQVRDTIEYEIQATNTGTAPLTLSLGDPVCDTGTVRGPSALSGTLSGDVLSPGGVAQYTCSHVLKASDPSPLTNTATVIGQPPTGPPVIGTASVVANKGAVLPVKTVRCRRGKVKRTMKVHGKRIIACVARKHKRRIIARRPIRPSGFTG